MNKPYWKIMLDLWKDKLWIDGVDYFRATHGSQKFTSRISDMRKKGIEITSRKVNGKDENQPHNVYALVTDREEAKKIMKGAK